MPTYRIEFYELTVEPTAQDADAFGALTRLAGMNNQLSVQVGGFVRELWGLRDDGQVVRGQFRKFRMDDFPEVGRVGGAGEELDLDDDQGLIEKNFFALYRRQSLLTWHGNGHASRPGQFCRGCPEFCVTGILGYR